MFKKTLSWILALSMLCACCLMLPVSAEPTDDATAISQGYHGRYENADGQTVYFKFNENKDGNSRDLAFANVPDGGTVTLIADATVTGAELYLTGNYTIEGGGHTLNAYFRTADNSTLANVTIRNLNLEKDVTGKGSFYQINAGNTCTFENCTFTVSGSVNNALFIPRGNLIFKDSSFKYVTTSEKPVFFNNNESGNGATVINTSFDLSEAPNAVVGLGGGINNRYYTRFADAMAAASAGDTVRLFADYKATANDYERFIITKNIVFDGNGNTIYGNAISYFLRLDSTAEVRNLTVRNDGQGAAMQVNAGATATIKNSTIRCTNTTPYGAVIVNGKMILEGGSSIIAEGTTTDGTKSVAIRMHTAGAEVVINDGATITTVGNTFKANAASSSKITINGGTITTDRRIWEAASNSYTLIINGGTFISNHATDALICVFGNKDQNIHLNGGTFTAKKIIDTENAVKGLGGKITLNGKVIFEGPVDDSIVNTEATIRLPGNNQADQSNSGLRFETRLDKAWIDALNDAGVTVTTGTIITSKASVTAVGAFTKEALDAAGKKYVIVENDAWFNADTATDYYQYFATLVNLKATSLTGNFAGIGYVTITVSGIGTFTYYGNEQNAVVRDLAEKITAKDDAQREVLDFFRGVTD